MAVSAPKPAVHNTAAHGFQIEGCFIVAARLAGLSQEYDTKSSLINYNLLM